MTELMPLSYVCMEQTGGFEPPPPVLVQGLYEHPDKQTFGAKLKFAPKVGKNFRYRVIDDTLKRLTMPEGKVVSHAEHPHAATSSLQLAHSNRTRVPKWFLGSGAER